MGLFRKKQHHGRADETMDTTYHEESVGKERRSLGKWVCGSKASKQTLEEDNKITSKGSHSSSTASSHEDKREDSKASRDERQQTMRDLDHSLMLASLPPPAAQSAFDGPPRFDWIDVEFHAATRIQTIFRRHRVLKEMEYAGLTTSYIRNRRRQRKAKASSFFPSADDDAAPELGFGCCSMGLAFGNDGFDPSDSIAYDEYQRMQYREKTRAQKEREEFLSQSYMEQKGIYSKAQELNESKFGNEMLMGL